MLWCSIHNRSKHSYETSQQDLYWYMMQATTITNGGCQTCSSSDSSTEVHLGGFINDVQFGIIVVDRSNKISAFAIHQGFVMSPQALCSPTVVIYHQLFQMLGAEFQNDHKKL